MSALGIDVGGTFTDAVLVSADRLVTAKVLSTASQEEGVVAASREVLERAGVEPGDVTHFVHGSTVATNALLERYLPGLRRVNPAFDPSWVKASWLHREPAAQPIVTVGYDQRIPPLKTSIPGLVLANTTQVYPEDRGTNYAVRLGDEAAKAI